MNVQMRLVEKNKAPIHWHLSELRVSIGVALFSLDAQIVTSQSTRACSRNVSVHARHGTHPLEDLNGDEQVEETEASQQEAHHGAGAESCIPKED